MFKTKKFWYISLFALLYGIVAFSSFWHAILFFGLANNPWMSVILAFAFEVGQAAVLFSLLTSQKDRGRVMPWVLMIMFTLVQVIGNVFSSYKYLITNSVENLRYFKEPIFIWMNLPDDQATVIVTYIVGAILPIAALLLTSMITNYLSDNEEEKLAAIPESSENGPQEPIIIHDKNEFDEVYKNDSLINQNSILQSENQSLKEFNAKKNEEIDKLKQELEDLKQLQDNKQYEAIEQPELELDNSVNEKERTDIVNDEEETVQDLNKKPSHFINL